MKTKILSIFPAFKNRNYKLYFIGQLISLTGTWLQMVAEGWLVLKMSNSPFLIGLVAAAGTVPTLIFSLYGGLIADKFSKKKIMIATQIAAMILAIILGILTILNIITVWEIIVLAFLLGVVTAIDSPARQAFIVEMVGKEELGSVVALNSGMFNSARVIGPALAGFLIAIFGIGGAFILNGLSYIAVIAALMMMTLKSVVNQVHSNPFKAIKEGITYAACHPVIRGLLLYTGIMSIFGWSYATMMPYIAKNTFHVDAEGLGVLYAATGIGALAASFIGSAYAKKVNAKVFIFGGNILFVGSIIAFTFTTNIIIALIFLFLSGAGLLFQFFIINTKVQEMVEDQYRGRVMALYSLMFLGLFPVGNLEVGFLSEHFGTDLAIRINAVILLSLVLIIFFNRSKVTESYEDYKNNL